LRVRASIVAIAAVGWLVSATPTAEAVFPGSNGRIAFTRPDRILTMEPDGSDVVVIRRNAGEPAWNRPARMLLGRQEGGGRTSS
jgi:hypothetical protein